jgi:hypothetical protein
LSKSQSPGVPKYRNMESKITTHLFLEISPRQHPCNYLVDGILQGRYCLQSLGKRGRPSQNIEAADGFPVFFQQVLQYIPKTATKASSSNDRDDKKTRNRRDVLPEVAPSPAGCQRRHALHGQCSLLFRPYLSLSRWFRPRLSLSQWYGPEFWDELS